MSDEKLSGGGRPESHELTVEQRAAYQECLDIASRNGWNAAYYAISGDGPEGEIDWIAMAENWRKDDRASSSGALGE